MDSTATRRSSRAVKPVEKAKAAPVLKKTTKKAVGAARRAKDSPSSTAVAADGVVTKRKVGRPLGSTKTTKTPVSVSDKSKGPERRGSKPKASTLTARATAAATTGTAGKGVNVEEQVSNLDMAPKKSNAGRKRKVEVSSADNTSAKRKAVGKEDVAADAPVKGKHGRPTGSGKKASTAGATATTTASESESKAAVKDDTEGDYSGIKLTIERW